MSKRHRRERQQGPTQAEGEGLWVFTEPDDHGGYVTVVSIDQDWSVSLDRESALRYAVACLEAAARVEFDAAVWTQMTRKLELSPVAAVRLVEDDLRPDRPPLPEPAPGLAFLPGVTEAGKPFIHIVLHGQPHAQMDPPALRQHAMYVLETPIAAELDAGYRRALVGIIGIEEVRAANVIGDLASHRWKFR